MSFTTRCPACGTMFKVVPDQLKISDGWVRCGHCADVFDATLYLEGEGISAPAALSEPASAPAVPSRTMVDDDGDGDWLLAPKPRKPEPAADAFRPPVPAPVPRAAVQVQNPNEPQRRDDPPSSAMGRDAWLDSRDRADSGFAPSRSRSVSGWDRPSSIFPESAPASRSPHSRSMGSPSRLPAVTDDDPAGLMEPGFVRQARRRALWRSPLVRALMVVLSVVLGALLVAQWLVHERDRLAAQYPAMVSALATLCQPVGCQLGPVRRIESVVIDSSNLVRRQGNTYSLDLVLKNSASMPVAMPALELSLTDTRDGVISRRVFLPADLPGSPALLPAAGTLPMSLKLSIADSGVSSMTGYRALVFYP